MKKIIIGVIAVVYLSIVIYAVFPDSRKLLMDKVERYDFKVERSYVDGGKDTVTYLNVPKDTKFKITSSNGTYKLKLSCKYEDIDIDDQAGILRIKILDSIKNGK